MRGTASQPNANVSGFHEEKRKEKSKKEQRERKKSIQPNTNRRIRHEQGSMNQRTAYTTALITFSRICTHNFGCILMKTKRDPAQNPSTLEFSKLQQDAELHSPRTQLS
jgi:hypothetical protein